LARERCARKGKIEETADTPKLERQEGKMQDGGTTRLKRQGLAEQTGRRRTLNQLAVAQVHSK
jgi:hypothetical protein